MDTQIFIVKETCKMGKFKEELFIEKFNQHSGGKYKYLGYENGQVSFLCNIHNVIDHDTPSHLLGNRGCKLCGKEKRKRLNEAANQKARNEFADKANKIHNGKYDYSKVEYIKTSEKVCVICPEHGEFWITPNSHLNGSGCRLCAIRDNHDAKRKSVEQFISESKNVHGDKYDYSKVKYVNSKTKVCIICPEHGEFWQSPLKHLIGQGCPKCGIEKVANGQRFDTDTFIKRAKEVHGDKYDYSKVEYKGYDKPVCIICPEHGEFWQTPDSHLQGSGCQRCAKRLSKNEDEIYNFIAGIIGKENVEKSNTSILPNHAEIDILVPHMKIGIEYNGCRWHTEQFGKGKYYHLEKTKTCKENGISLIHIFEDEYVDKKDIVLSKLKHILKQDNSPKINGRKCIIEEISYPESKEFLENNHIQGSQKATVYLGAKFNDELVGVMTFVKLNENEWELNRFASSIKHICNGVGGKLFSYFLKNYNPTYIKSFADRRWTLNEENNLYTKLGFKLGSTLKPDYKYVLNGSYKRIHKFNFRKQILHNKYGLPLELTENEMAEKIGAYKIWDCGLYKYIWVKKP